MTDTMAVMLEAQRHLQQTKGHDFDNMPQNARLDYIRTMVLACEDELHEALGETGWKPWASSNHINRQEYVGEIADAWLFLMNLMLVVGMTADELIDTTAKKQDNAYARMKGDYDGVSSKCPICKRAYDNVGIKCTPTQCGYYPPVTITAPEAKGFITTSQYPTDQCPGCGNPWNSLEGKDCFPQGQAFGWCAVTSRTIGLQVSPDA